MNRTVRPIHRSCDMTMLDRIDVDVIDVPGEIIFIGDEMFPKPALPHAALALA